MMPSENSGAATTTVASPTTTPTSGNKGAAAVPNGCSDGSDAKVSFLRGVGA